MEQKRPTLNDPAEYALIKQIYFKDDVRFIENQLPPDEISDRIDAKLRSSNKSSR